MDEALLALLDQKDYEYIAVSEICKKAGVHRSTFYLHYEGVNDLLKEAVSYLYRDLLERYKEKDAEPLYFFKKEYSLPYLSFIKEHRYAFLAAYRQPMVLMFRERWSPSIGMSSALYWKH